MEDQKCLNAVKVDCIALKTICRKIPGFPVNNCSNNTLVFWKIYDKFVKNYNKLTNGMNDSEIKLLDKVLKNYCELNKQRNT